LMHCAVLAHVVSPVPLADYWSPFLHGHYSLLRYYGSSAILRPVDLPLGFTPCSWSWTSCPRLRTSRVDCLVSLRMPGSQTPPGGGRTYDSALSPVGFRNAKFVAPRDTILSRLNHFTLSHSGLRSSLHTLYAAPFEIAHNARYIMVRYSFDGGTHTRKTKRPFHGALAYTFTPSGAVTPMSVSANITSLPSLTWPSFDITRDFRATACKISLECSG
jgi:hypothetical protein